MVPTVEPVLVTLAPESLVCREWDLVKARASQDGDFLKMETCITSVALSKLLLEQTTRNKLGSKAQGNCQLCFVAMDSTWPFIYKYKVVGGRSPMAESGVCRLA